MAKFDQHLLDDIRDRLPISEVVGSRVTWDRKKTNPSRGDYWACCPIHGERSPSFHCEDGKGRYHCLAGDTVVVTRYGRQMIRDLVGRDVELLTPGGWQRAPIKSYGVQRLFEIAMSRNGVHKTVRATSGHRWFIRSSEGRNAEKTTSGLRKGHRLAYALAPAVEVDRLSLDGIRHGFVFGDGHMAYQRTSSIAQICGMKREFMPQYFHGLSQLAYTDRTIVQGLDRRWKKLPDTDAGARYLAGFLAGFMAADGHVAKDGTVMLHQTDPNVLEAVRDIATMLGIATFSVTHQDRIGIGQTEPSRIHRIHFATSTFPAAYLLNPEHRARLEASTKKFERFRWAVQSVTDTGQDEEVFCAEVPVHHAFCLDDNLLTGNCFGCGISGDIFGFLMEVDGLSFPRAVEACAQMAGISMPGAREETAAEKEKRRRRAAELERKKQAADARAARESEAKISTAAGIWKSTLPLAGSLAEVYLQTRGLTIGDEPNLRFHPRLRHDFSRKWHPCLVARVQAADGGGRAVWRIFLSDDGTDKAYPKGSEFNSKMGLGPARGGAVRLGGEGPVIGIAEGVETALAAREMDRRHPIWAGLSTSGMQTFDPPAFVRRVLVYPDGDSPRWKDGEVKGAPGLHAATTLRDRLTNDGFPCAIVEPPVGGDYLDILKATKGY